MTRLTGRLKLSEIQRSVVRGSSQPAAEFHFLRVADAPAARRFLAEIVDQVTTAEQRHTPEFALTVAFTFRGLRALRLPSTSLSGFSDEFRAGMAARAGQLRDTGADAPRYWERGPDQQPDVLFWTAGPADELAASTAGLIRRAVSSGLVESFAQKAALLPGDSRREHFGFVDGLSQPRIEGLHPAPRWPGWPGRGNASAERPIRAGEFILGYLDEDGALPPGPEPARLARNGSYLVYRKLRQDVRAFRQLLAQAQPRYEPEELAAKLVGRWRDGSPLILAPRRPDPAVATRRSTANAFGYDHDPDGWVCPAGAHIRRANPRDGLPFHGSLVNRHRMIRRGIPYGPPLPDPADEPDGNERGLVFVCFVADIARQFEFVQSHWLQDGNAFGLGEDRDPLTGSGLKRFLLPGRPPRFVAEVPPLVTMRWGEYLFAPGIAGLRWIASGGSDANPEGDGHGR